MSNAYSILKNKHQEEVNNFPMVFAFSNDQFAEGMAKLGLAAEDTDKVFSIGGGGFIRKSDADAFNELFTRHHKEMQQAIDSDPTGEGFIYDMFFYELANHEYGYTYEVGDTLDALGLTSDDIHNNPKLNHGLALACKKIREQSTYY